MGRVCLIIWSLAYRHELVGHLRLDMNSAGLKRPACAVSARDRILPLCGVETIGLYGSAQQLSGRARILLSLSSSLSSLPWAAQFAKSERILSRSELPRLKAQSNNPAAPQGYPRYFSPDYTVVSSPSGPRLGTNPTSIIVSLAAPRSARRKAFGQVIPPKLYPQIRSPRLFSPAQHETSFLGRRTR